MDFNKLRTQKQKTKVIDPIDIFRRLAKPAGINDLYTSQAEVLSAWFNCRSEKDTVLKLHTGGGKTLVGLLVAQSTLNETGEPVLYLTPNTQLVKQTIEKANAIGISAVAYESGKPLNDAFVNGNAIMVATYKALFNGKSKFGIRGSANSQNVAAVILDDAHAAFSIIRESFTLEVIAKKNRTLFENLSNLFRSAFKEVDRLGTFDDILTGSEFAVLEVPYWAWNQKIEVVRELLKPEIDNYDMVWPLLRDNLHLCHVLISRKSFTITPIQPLINLFPTFFDAKRRIFMSATIADDSDIISTFDAGVKSVKSALTSRSLAGISERMILVPDLMRFKTNSKDVITKLLEWTSEMNLGSIILTASDKSAQDWADVATIAKGSQEAEKFISELQRRVTSGPIVFANRYDGMDLPGDSCRLLIMSRLPMGTSNYDLFKSSALFGGDSVIKMMAQRIEQGIGRGSRGSGDYCVVILTGADLSGWISKETNFGFLTSATKAQIDIGIQMSKEIENLEDLKELIQQSYDRKKDWVEYHAETLAELIDENAKSNLHLEQALVERKAVNLWQDGYFEKAIYKIEDFLANSTNLDNQSRGWMRQLSARIANNWGNFELSEEKQRDAYSLNRNLIRPRVLPPYRTLPLPGDQAKSIIEQLSSFHNRRGFIKAFDYNASFLHADASANQFEKALCDLGKMIGIEAERYDNNGEGPDVLWLLPNKSGFVIEAKSRKNDKNSLTKAEHGQLLVAAEWFGKNYPTYTCIRVSVHPKNHATKAAVAGYSYVLTYDKLAALIADARLIISLLSESLKNKDDLLVECENLLLKSNVRFDQLATSYLVPFKELDNDKI